MAIVESITTLRRRLNDRKIDLQKAERRMKASDRQEDVAEWENAIVELTKRRDDLEKVVKAIRAAKPVPIQQDEKGEFIVTRYVVCENPKCDAILVSANPDTGEEKREPYRGQMADRIEVKWYGARCPACNAKLGHAGTKKTATGGGAK
jgi:hypothetical protein